MEELNKLFIQQDDFLNQLEEELGIEINKLDDDENQKLIFNNCLITHDISFPETPRFKFDDWHKLNKEWPDVEYDLFPRWKVIDVPVMVIAGFLGALISNGLHDTFRYLHDNKWGKASFDEGGHSGEIPDNIRGLFHRLKYGHDILNPFEIDWDKYFSFGDPGASIVKKIWAWIRHMMQDTFSTEGLPLPGNSYIRELLLKFVLGNVPGMKKHEVYKTFFTIKMRDLTSTAFIALVMTGYIYGTEKGNEKKFFNYRYNSLMIGSLALSIIFGLFMPKRSFNHSALVAIIPYLVTLNRVDKVIEEQLLERDKVILTNEHRLNNNLKEVLTAEQQYEQYMLKLNHINNELQKISEQNKSIINIYNEEFHNIMIAQEKYLSSLERNI